MKTKKAIKVLNKFLVKDMQNIEMIEFKAIIRLLLDIHEKVNGEQDTSEVNEESWESKYEDFKVISDDFLKQQEELRRINDNHFKNEVEKLNEVASAIGKIAVTTAGAKEFNKMAGIENGKKKYSYPVIIDIGES